jgi:hypothetical protein
MGADQIFARAVLSLSGEFDVILPARDYPAEMAKSSGAESFSELIGAARNVCTMAYEVSSREAYRAASEEMLHRSDLLLAAWNGEPSRSVGDTADVVGMAQAMGRRVEFFWPSGLSRVSQTG